MKAKTQHLCIIIGILIVIAGCIVISRNSNETYEDYDVAPEVYVNSMLYRGGSCKFYYNKPEFVYLGEISSSVVYPAEPQKELQSNYENLIGSKVYQYGKKVVVLTDGKYWEYFPCER